MDEDQVKTNDDDEVKEDGDDEVTAAPEADSTEDKPWEKKDDDEAAAA